MRLLNTATGQFRTFTDPRRVRYAILSHVWTKPEDLGSFPPEQTYAEILKIQQNAPPALNGLEAIVLSELSTKIQEACKIARTHGFEWIWIDTCCIDQTSSAEVSESINSMYEFYSCSKVCYAYLRDVAGGEAPQGALSKFRRSLWFKRGWTLQELIGPQKVLFLSKEWEIIGTKNSLAEVIKEETNIDTAVLKRQILPSQVSVAERMGWAAHRITLKEEDRAYCLIGLFGVHLMPIYGEGKNAFIRLQMAILQLDTDQSIFAWGKSAPFSIAHQSPSDDTSAATLSSSDVYLLAPSPSSFIERPSKITPMSPEQLSKRLGGLHVGYPRYSVTSSGIRTKFPIIQYTRSDNVCRWLAILSCVDQNDNLIALVLHPASAREHASDSEVRSCNSVSVSDRALLVGAPAPRSPDAFSRSPTDSGLYRLVSLTRQDVDALRAEDQPRADVKVHVKHCALGADISPHRQEGDHMHMALSYDLNIHPFTVKLSPWSSDILTKQHGYLVPVDGFTAPGAERSSLLELRKGPDTIVVSFGYCICESGRTRKAFRVEVQPKAPLPGPKLQCDKEHIEAWSYSDGIASSTYNLKHTSTGRLRQLHLSLTSADGPGSDADSRQARHSSRQFLLDIELIVSPPPGLDWPSSSSTSLTAVNHTDGMVTHLTPSAQSGSSFASQFPTRGAAGDRGALTEGYAQPSNAQPPMLAGTGRFIRLPDTRESNGYPSAAHGVKEKHLTVPRPNQSYAGVGQNHPTRAGTSPETGQHGRALAHTRESPTRQRTSHGVANYPLNAPRRHNDATRIPLMDRPHHRATASQPRSRAYADIKEDLIRPSAEAPYYATVTRPTSSDDGYPYQGDSFPELYRSQSPAPLSENGGDHHGSEHSYGCDQCYGQASGLPRHCQNQGQQRSQYPYQTANQTYPTPHTHVVRKTHRDLPQLQMIPAGAHAHLSYPVGSRQPDGAAAQSNRYRREPRTPGQPGLGEAHAGYTTDDCDASVHAVRPLVADNEVVASVSQKASSLKGKKKKGWLRRIIPRWR